MRTNTFRIETRRHYPALLMAAFWIGAPTPEALRAQVLPPDPSATRILESYDALTRDGGNAGNRMVRAFLNAGPEQTELDTLVDGLAQLALEGSTHGVRMQAEESLFLWALADVERNPRRVVEVLEGVYANTPDAGSKATITLRMPELGPQAGVIDFLRRVAITEETPWEGIPERAIEGLAKLGEPGRAVLRELHAQKAVTVWRARQRLEDLARRDFRIGGGSP